MKYKNYINKVSKDNRIYTKKDIADMTVKDAFSRKKELMFQNRQIGIPTEYELQNSSNVIWVNSYVREDGTQVKGYWRAKHGSIDNDVEHSPIDKQKPDWEKHPIDAWSEKPPTESKKDNIPDDYDVEGDATEEESTTSIILNTIVAIAEILFPESEIVEAAKVLSPLLTGIITKLMPDDSIDFSLSDDEQVTQKETMNNEEGMTGAAAEINTQKEAEKDTPQMTKNAEMQKIVAKYNPIANSYPEQEYYKISLNLQKVRETGNVPSWMKEHNDVRTLNEIGNKELAQKIREKVIKGATENQDTETLKNLDSVFVITVKPSSDLAKLVMNDPNFHATLEENLSDIKKGKYNNSYFSFGFEDNPAKEKDEYKMASTYKTIHLCDVHDVKIDTDGYISATIIDYYNFDKHNMSTIPRNAYIQQQNKKLENYALVIPIRVKIKKNK